MVSMEEAFERACAEYKIPGAILLAANTSGTFKYEHVCGSSSLQDASSKPPLKMDNVMWIASCTKLMTSIAALQLVQRGHLELDNDVSWILPELADLDILTGFVDDNPQFIKAKNKVTMRLLLTHSSGICYDFMSPLLAQWRAYRNEGMSSGKTVLEAYTVPLIYEPGTAWSYGPGVDYAGLIIERISDLSLQEYFMKNIWQTLGIKDITFHLDQKDDLRTRLTDMSMRDPLTGQAVYSPDRFWNGDATGDFGGLGLFSTAPEYFKLVQAVLRQDKWLLTESNFEEMFRPQLTDESRASLMAILARPEIGAPLGGLPGEMKKDYGLAGLLLLEDLPDSRRSGTLTWGGMPNLTWIRQASVIIPKTGQRVRRTVTLGVSPGLTPANGNGNADEESPLLGVPKAYRKPLDTPRMFLEVTRHLYHNVWNFARSRTGKGVLKCSIAYLLGSLATFVPAIAAMLGQQDGKHLVATITVYFHPARSQGSMFEAVILAVLAFAYAAFIGFTSMAISIFFSRVVDLVVVGHIIVLVVFCGGGLGFVGWIKQRLGHPLVNISCSLTSLAIITVLTKEGAVQEAKFSDDKIVQVLKMIVMGVVATTAVSFLIYPVSARIDLRENLISFTDSLSEVFATTTGCFLVGSEEELTSPRYRAAMDKYKSQLASIEKNLVEAKYEHYVAGTEGEFWLEARLVDCMQRLAQCIGGLRSAATTQFLILAQPGLGTPTGDRSRKATGATAVSTLEHSTILDVIDEASENGESDPTADHAGQDSTSSILTPGDVFAEFIEHLGPSIKSLTYTLREILDDLPFSPGPEYQVTVDAQYRSSLEAAVKLYSQSREAALSKIYDTNEVNKDRSVDVEADFEEIAASCGVFSYTLQDFANEMMIYLDILDNLKLEIEEKPKGRTWDWLKVWRRNRNSRTKEDSRSINAIDQEADVLSNVPNLPHHRPPIIESEKEGQRNTHRYRLWKALAIFRRDDTKFAIKVGAGAALYALPSFLSATRPFYQHFRGEWGLLSYMLVCSMTIGASNTTGYARFLGTCLGAVCAIVAWTLSGENPFALAAFGWLMSFWTAYVIVAQGKGPMGRFIMLTYNLSALYAYSLSVKDLDDDDDEGGISPIITEITFHRTVAVLSGCVWGLIITRLIWPISARQKLKDGLSVLWLRMGLIWKRRPMECRLQGNSINAYMDLEEESLLHRYLAQLEKLRESAASEVNLRGPFPVASYKSLLSSTGGILDALHAMNVMILKDPRMSAGEAAILRSTTAERAQFSLRITHLFQVMASSIKLEYPLNNDALPSIEKTRDRLLAKIFGFRKEAKSAVITSDEDFALLYSYVLVTGQLANAMKDISSELESLFGVLNEDVLKLYNIH
ncbi:MAG: hypothetical protein Q9166_005461 [cf. Caloplaca sp. 2 TL-2023]